MTPTILVVEDQAAMLRNIQMGLEMSNYAVVLAADGVEALEVLRNQPVDLILADIAMPRMNGYQLYEQLRQNPHWALIPFVFISARGLDSDVRYGKTLGVDDYLVKPFKLEDLLAVVAGRLRRAQDLAQAVARSAAAAFAPAKPPLPLPRPAPAESDWVVVGALHISLGQHRVWNAGVPVELSPHEFAFLEYLAGRPGKAVSLTELCQATHSLKTDAIEAGSLLYPVVRSLRRRLGYRAGESGCIESVRGIGYRLVAS